MQARSADSLVETYGVNVHLTYGNTPYSKLSAITSRLEQLGVRHLRDRLSPGNARQYDAINSLSRAGMNFDLIMGAPGAAAPEKLVQIAASKLAPGSVESFEGANEWDVRGGSGWVTDLRKHQTALYRAAKADPATKNLPVLAPSLAFGTRYAAQLGDLSSVADLGNNHLYPGGHQPSSRIDEQVASERLVVGSRPMIFTETGYHNATGTTSTHPGTPEDVVGVYAPELLLEHFQRGNRRMFTYELVDERPDPGKTDKEAEFGLLRHDLSPKPAFTAMQNLLSLTADRGPAFRPGTLSYRVTGAPPELEQVLLQKRNGAFYLALWRNVPVYDPVHKSVLPSRPRRYTWTLAATPRYRCSAPPHPAVRWSGA